LQKNLAPAPESKPPPKVKENTVGPEKTQLAMVTKESQPKPETAAPPKPQPPKAELKPQPPAPPRAERIVPEAESKSHTGVSREGIKAIDVTGTKYGEYDRRVIAAVKTRWLLLLEQYTIPGERAGQVSLRFHLNADGSVSELVVAENSAGDILGFYCQKAITDSAPFGPWPEELKDLVKRDYRELNFIFYY
jgi:protein TonB